MTCRDLEAASEAARPAIENRQRARLHGFAVSRQDAERLLVALGEIHGAGGASIGRRSGDLDRK